MEKELDPFPNNSWAGTTANNSLAGVLSMRGSGLSRRGSVGMIGEAWEGGGA